MDYFLIVISLRWLYKTKTKGFTICRKRNRALFLYRMIIGILGVPLVFYSMVSFRALTKHLLMYEYLYYIGITLYSFFVQDGKNKWMCIWFNTNLIVSAFVATVFLNFIPDDNFWSGFLLHLGSSLIPIMECLLMYNFRIRLEISGVYVFFLLFSSWCIVIKWLICLGIIDGVPCEEQYWKLNWKVIFFVFIIVNYITIGVMLYIRNFVKWAWEVNGTPCVFQN